MRCSLSTPPLLRKSMKKVAYLLTLTMLLASLAGCAGDDDDDDDSSPVGDWYSAEAMIMDMNEDGTLIDGEGNSGTWSTDGGILTMTIAEANEFNYAVEEAWLWIKMVDDDDDCYPLQSESMTDEEREASLSELTPPSFC